MCDNCLYSHQGWCIWKGSHNIYCVMLDTRPRRRSSVISINNSICCFSSFNHQHDAGWVTVIITCNVKSRRCRNSLCNWGQRRRAGGPNDTPHTFVLASRRVWLLWRECDYRGDLALDAAATVLLFKWRRNLHENGKLDKSFSQCYRVSVERRGVGRQVEGATAEVKPEEVTLCWHQRSCN